jgi:hypothetical protein
VGQRSKQEQTREHSQQLFTLVEPRSAQNAFYFYVFETAPLIQRLGRTHMKLYDLIRYKKRICIHNLTKHDFSMTCPPFLSKDNETFSVLDRLHGPFRKGRALLKYCDYDSDENSGV